jgi:hypothetical protein
MRSEEEIREKLEIYKEIQFRTQIFTSEFTLANGAITALEWVLGVKNEQ